MVAKLFIPGVIDVLFGDTQRKAAAAHYTTPRTFHSSKGIDTESATPEAKRGEGIVIVACAYQHKASLPQPQPA